MELKPIQILFEDNELIVVFKPHRTPIQKDKTGHPNLFEQVCLYLKEKHQVSEKIYLGMVHRIDRAASGIIVFAKTSQAANHLSEQFRNRTVEKFYEALVENKPNEQSGKLISYLSSPDEGPSLVYAVETQGTKKAELNFEVIGTKSQLSLVRIKLLTGRRHQIRAQLAAIGCPLLGDGKYGSKTPFLTGSIALVARELSFLHPTTNKVQQFQIPSSLSSVNQFYHHN